MSSVGFWDSSQILFFVYYPGRWMFMGADLSLCVQGGQDRKTVSRKEREGWSYGELVQRCNWYLSFSRKVSYFQGSSE